jgi:hypothetical protein
VETSLFPEPTGAPLEFQPIALTAQAVIALHSTRQLTQVGQRVQPIPPLHVRLFMTKTYEYRAPNYFAVTGQQTKLRLGLKLKLCFCIVQLSGFPLSGVVYFGTIILYVINKGGTFA